MSDRTLNFAVDDDADPIVDTAILLDNILVAFGGFGDIGAQTTFPPAFAWAGFVFWDIYPSVAEARRGV